MSTGPASPDPGPGDAPAGRPGEPAGPDDDLEGWRELPPSHEDWLTEDEWVASLSLDEEDWIYPGDDPDGNPESDPGGPWQPGITGSPSTAGTARSRAAVGGRPPKGAVGPPKSAARVARGGRRGPGQPGSARWVVGASPGPAGSFAAGHPLDTAPGGAALLGLAEYAAGPDDRFPGTSDDELTGIICALDRAEAAACALKHAAVAELIRRRPAPDREPVLAGPGSWEEFTSTELSWALAESRPAAGNLLDQAQILQEKLPGTYAAFRAGIVRESKAAIIARGVTALNPAEARAAEARVLDRAGRVTPGRLRAVVRQAVIAVAPAKAAKRRKDAERNARVERWAEDSGNAALSGRELPPADVIAADQRIAWWAKQLKKAGLDGDMDQLRARAFLDILLGRDSTTAHHPVGTTAHHPVRTTTDTTHTTGTTGTTGTPAGGTAGLPPTSSVLPAGFTGCVNLTTPLSTLLDLLERPGELAGIGPVDPDLARDLTRAAAVSPKTTWCVTVTDDQGHAIGHGCARPAPTNHPRTTNHPQPAPPSAHDPPPRLTFTASGQPGPPGGYGSWRLATGVPGRPDLLIDLDPIALDTCDHRYQAPGHNPGVKLRHLTQIRHATCTGPTCRRPSAQCDFEHNTPYENGGATCLCNTGPKCRSEHRLKQHPRWNVEQLTPGTFRWTAPSGRQYTTEPTRYPI